MFKHCVLYFLSAAYLNAQMPNDCSGALVVCDDSTLNLDAQGIGVQEVSGTNNCDSSENNSIWLKLNIQNSGTFGFILTPNSTNIAIDYDFFLYGPDVDCGAIGKAIRCSTTNPAMANMSHNQTGMNSSEIDLSEGPGRAGNSFVRELNVLAGESYFLVIDRPIGMSPFSLEWTGTATLPPLPTNPIQKSDMDMDFCDSKFPYGDDITEIDLTDRTRQIMNSQNDVIVSYHLSESDANLSNRPLGDVFDNVGNPQKIYMKTQNTITGCYRIDEFEIHVDRVKTVPSFDPIADVCEGGRATLPTTSKNGVTGTWSPAFDPNNTTTYTFTPDAGQCATTQKLTVNIIKKTTPDFDPIADVCEGTRITLPTTSKNGVTGTWLPAFDPNNTTTYTFTPDAGQCAKNTTLKVNITKKTVPSFDPISDVCEGTLITLPTTSKNGVTGTWSSPFDNTKTTTYIFTPSVGQCATTQKLTVNITKKTVPSFDPIADVCEGGRATLPTTSKNGVTGTWSSPFDNTKTTTYIFTPNAGQCATKADLEVGIISKKVLSISAKITTETFAKSPEIKVTLKERKGQYEYQLNNENWQESPIFSGIVGCKKHTIRVRELGGCSRPGMTSITVMDFPKFFTPNGDGYNDNWTINCLKNKITSISIFDRYGKLIKQLSAGDIGWDGTYQGVRLPSSDYWFIIAYKEDGVEKQFKSHFSLKR